MCTSIRSTQPPDLDAVPARQTDVASRSYTYDSLGRPTTRGTSRQGTVKNDTFTYNDRIM